MNYLNTFHNTVLASNLHNILMYKKGADSRGFDFCIVKDEIIHDGTFLSLDTDCSYVIKTEYLSIFYYNEQKRDEDFETLLKYLGVTKKQSIGKRIANVFKSLRSAVNRFYDKHFHWIGSAFIFLFIFSFLFTIWKLIEIFN